jgi:hypothetical protein
METKSLIKYNSASYGLQELFLNSLSDKATSDHPSPTTITEETPMSKIDCDDHSRKKKKVRFEHNRPDPQPEPITLPSLSAVELCQTLSAPQPANFCICYLESPEHLLYTGDGKPNALFQKDPPAPLTSLRDILRQTKNDIIDSLQKLKTAHRLTSAVLQYHSTPWLTEEWRLHDLHTFGTQKNDFDNILKSLHLSGQFPRSSEITAPMDGIEKNALDSAALDSVDARLAYGITNLTIFSLGVALLELGHWNPIQSGNDIIAARKLVERGSPLGPRYQDIVKRCLNCNFGFGTDISRPGLQNAIYNDVVCALEDMMGALDIGFD